MRISDWSSDVCSSDLVGKGNKFYSNEAQLSGTLYGDRLNFVVGYYYQHAPSTPDLVNVGSIQKVFGGITTLNLGYSATGPFTVGGRAHQSAFYGQATLSLDGLPDGVKLQARQNGREGKRVSAQVKN